MSGILEALRSANKGQNKPDLVLGEVLSFDSSNWTIDVRLNMGATIPEVTIKSVMNGEDSGIFVEPKVGSVVLCGMVDGRMEDMTVLSYSEIENIRFAPSKKIELRNTDFGGLVKSEITAQVDNAIKQEINKLKNIFTAWVPAPNDGGAALKGALSTWSTAMQTKVKADYENKNVQHG